MIAPALTGTAGDARTVLSWPLVAGAVKTQLRRAKGTGSFATVYQGKARSFTDTGLTNDTAYRYKARGVDAKGRLGPYSSEVVLMPCTDLVVTPPPPPPPPIVPSFGTRYGWGRTTSGGDGGVVIDVGTWAQYRAALEDQRPRTVKLHGSAVWDGAGADFSVTGDFISLDGSDFSGQIKDNSTKWRARQVVLTQMSLRPGEGASAGLSTDRSALRFLPPTGGSIDHLMVDHSSVGWGPDTTLSILNNSTDVTIQYSLIGPALFESNIPSSPNGYGLSLTTSGTNPAFYPKRVTVYRCLFAFIDERCLRGESGDWIEFINNVAYGIVSKPASGNMQHASYLGNMFKKDPDSAWVGGANNAWFAQIAGGVFNSYFPDSIYFPVAGDTADPSHVNIGITAAGAPFVPDRTFGGSSKRSTPYASAPTNAPLTTASVALANQVIAQAGRTHQDAIDTLIKAHALAGTTDGLYNGAGFSAPHPSW